MPISLLEEPEAAVLSQKRDRQVAEHALNAADHRSSMDLIGKLTVMIGYLPITRMAYLSLMLPL